MGRDISDHQILECQREIANGIVTKLNGVKRPGPVARAIEMITRRVVASGNSLAALRNGSPHDFSFDAASILRTTYDVMLQGLYIIVDPSKREKRSQLYLDFMDVERMRRIELIHDSPTRLANRLRESSKAATGEPAIKKRFEEVKGKFTGGNGGVRRDWYPGTLRDLARASGLEAEYEVIQKWLSGVVHSSPLTLKEGPLVDGLLVLNWHWRFAFRILGAYAKYKEIDLHQTEKDLIALARKNVLDFE